jgi:hypothetical protein
MAKRVTSVAPRTWCLDRRGFDQWLGVVEVERKSIEARATIKPRNEAGYTTAVVALNHSSLKTIAIGRAHIRPDMTMLYRSTDRSVGVALPCRTWPMVRPSNHSIRMLHQRLGPNT